MNNERTKLKRENTYCVQTGQFKENIKEINGMDSLICFDWMGYAEFEFGALPASTKRIVINNDFYDFFTLNEFTDKNGKPLIIYAPVMFIDHIRENVIALANGEKNLKTRSYRLQGYMKFDKPDWRASESDFFWDIENDFYIFFGEDKKDLILQAVNAMREKWMDTVEVGDPNELARYYLANNRDLSEEAIEYLKSKRENILARIFRPKK